MKLIRQNCGIEIKLVPYGAGWYDMYMTIGKDKLCFIMSYAFDQQFDYLLKALYYLYPEQNDPDHDVADDIITSKICLTNDKTGAIKLYDSLDELTPPVAYSEIPWKAEFEWDEERTSCHWRLERAPTLDTDFMLKIVIDLRREEKTFNYEVRYKDFCYAVAKACTAALKEYGFFGYHYSIYHEDLNIRYLLFIKAVALDCMGVRKLTAREKRGETTSFDKELELLLFDM